MSSVLRSLNQANSQLDRLLSGLGAYSDADIALRHIASELMGAVARAPDVAIACVLLNQVGGRYAVRHCVNSAVIACVAASAMGKTPLEVLTVGRPR
ncbi:MAG: metal-dependent phosphohydrolase [Massilia sp.]|nr:metal-dependent phosphohydrolase [Massilia sp.]